MRRDAGKEKILPYVDGVPSEVRPGLAISALFLNIDSFILYFVHEYM